MGAARTRHVVALLMRIHIPMMFRPHIACLLLVSGFTITGSWAEPVLILGLRGIQPSCQRRAIGSSGVPPCSHTSGSTCRRAVSSLMPATTITVAWQIHRTSISICTM